MYSLCDIGRVEIIVIGVPEPAVALFHFAQEVLQGRGVHFEFVNDAVPIEEVVAEVFHRLTARGFAQCKYVKRPFVKRLKTK